MKTVNSHMDLAGKIQAKPSQATEMVLNHIGDPNHLHMLPAVHTTTTTTTTVSQEQSSCCYYRKVQFTQPAWLCVSRRR
jgi:hypothetical protein